MQWFAQAPSNIALIKYMGKKNAEKNLPINSSLSYTLPNLQTNVSLELNNSYKDIWEPLTIPGAENFHLSLQGQKRFLAHLDRIKKFSGFTENFIIRSSNNFPHSSGLASSASSFAALTKCAFLAISDLTNAEIFPIETQAEISRLGSGSSCRSFFAPWALWQDEKVGAIDLPYNNLLHQVIIISRDAKPILSTNAHQRVQTSNFYKNRAQKAEENLQLLLSALQSQDWRNAYEICWNEFQNMHKLFQTSKPPFSYINSQTVEILTILQNFWEEKNDGPIITMDAGPNIHLLYRCDQKELAKEFKLNYLVGNYDVL